MKSRTSVLFLVRHGQDMDNSRHLINGRRDMSLSELGKTQARELAADLEARGIECVISSPLLRARQTALIIAETLGIRDVYVNDGLIERDYGTLTGMSPADIPSVATRIVVSHGFRYIVESPGIEEYPRLFARAGEVLREIREQHPDKIMLIVAHNEIIKMMRANFDGRSWEDELARPPLDHCQVVELRSP